MTRETDEKTSSANSGNAGSDIDFVDKTLAENENGITVFSLSWCGYCHSVKNLLGTLKTPFTAIDIDRPDFQHSGLTAQARQRLRQLTGQTTLPQVFVGNESVGGYTETSMAIRQGRWRSLLEKHKVKID